MERGSSRRRYGVLGGDIDVHGAAYEGGGVRALVYEYVIEKSLGNFR